ncbi:MAG TPA: lysozyme inhibitor LprI family protein [Verrucomicrobiae bacterium]|jgi:uncharacterized protein YecT (DUF1311 family)|nr:lysozyme inhibitor LprI family protein [Verrucomicrobiae bacterium]
MKKVWTLAFVIVLLSGASHGKPPKRPCEDTAMTQYAMNMCAKHSADLAEHEMNDLYRRLLLRAAKYPGAAAKVRAAQRAWLAYRDAYVHALYWEPWDNVHYGTVFPMNVSYTIAAVTSMHSTDLKWELIAYNNERNCGWIDANGKIESNC